MEYSLLANEDGAHPLGAITSVLHEQGVDGIYLRADFKQERRLSMEWYSS